MTEVSLNTSSSSTSPMNYIVVVDKISLPEKRHKGEKNVMF